MGLIEGIDVVFYGVCNMNRSVAFYEGVLGLEINNRAGNDWTQFTVGGTELGLFGELATPPHQGGATVSFKVSDVRAFEQVLGDVPPAQRCQCNATQSASTGGGAPSWWPFGKKEAK